MALFMDDPIGRVKKALAGRGLAEKRLDRARAELHAAIVAALDAGVRQAELVHLTGYTRERIRQIANDARRSPGDG